MRVVGTWNLQNGLMWKGRHEGSLDLGMNQRSLILIYDQSKHHVPLILNFYPFCLGSDNYEAQNIMFGSTMNLALRKQLQQRPLIITTVLVKINSAGIKTF